MYAAWIEIGWDNGCFEGETANEIIDKVAAYQDFGCLVMLAQQMESEAVFKKLEAFVDKYWERELTMDDLKKLNIQLSIGWIKCHGVAEGEEEIKALKEKAKE